MSSKTNGKSLADAFARARERPSDVPPAGVKAPSSVSFSPVWADTIGNGVAEHRARVAEGMRIMREARERRAADLEAVTVAFADALELDVDKLRASGVFATELRPIIGYAKQIAG